MFFLKSLDFHIYHNIIDKHFHLVIYRIFIHYWTSRLKNIQQPCGVSRCFLASHQRPLKEKDEADSKSAAVKGPESKRKGIAWHYIQFQRLQSRSLHPLHRSHFNLPGWNNHLFLFQSQKIIQIRDVPMFSHGCPAFAIFMKHLKNSTLLQLQPSSSLNFPAVAIVAVAAPTSDVCPTSRTFTDVRAVGDKLRGSPETGRIDGLHVRMHASG